MAIACLRLLTFLPLRAALERALLAFAHRASSTSFEALLEYLRAMIGSGLDTDQDLREWNVANNLLLATRFPRTVHDERLRADRLLVERGLFESRAKAQAAIEAGLVRANGAVGAQSIG